MLIKNSSNKGKKDVPPDGFQPKILLIYILIIDVVFALWSSAKNTSESSIELSISEVRQKIENGQIPPLKGSMTPNPDFGREGYKIKGIFTDDSRDFTSSEDMDFSSVRFEAEGRLTEDDFVMFRDYFSEKQYNTLLQDVLVGFLPFILIFGLLYFVFVRQIKSAGRGAMSFGKSKAKLLVRDKDAITFKDVAGCDEAKEEVGEVVDFLKDPKKFQKIGGKIPKGILMVGPPGTGKTLLAKAVAGEADVPFFSISGSDFVEMFVGVGAARVRDMFEQGRKNAPCIVFIDEIDAVGRQRGAGLGGGNDEREQTLNSLLVEMDGFDGHEGVIIVAATNRPDVLDNALLRPGRFDRQVTIDLPDLIGRHEVLKVHSKKVILSDEVNLENIAKNTPGFSGADLANLLNEGALIAARHNKKLVENQDLEEARDKISFGRERRKLMDEEDRRITAFHEAGHAIVQAIIDDGTLPVHKVTIIPRGQSLGSTMFMPKKDILNHSKKRLLNQICCGMGGRCAEEIIIGDITSGAAGDIKMVTKTARHMVCDWGMTDLGPVAYGENKDHIFIGQEIERTQNYSEATAIEIDRKIHTIVEKEYERAMQILKDNKEALVVCANALLEHETIDGKHVYEIVKFGKIESPVIKRESLNSKNTNKESELPSGNKKTDNEGNDISNDESPLASPA